MTVRSLRVPKSRALPRVPAERRGDTPGARTGKQSSADDCARGAARARSPRSPSATRRPPRAEQSRREPPSRGGARAAHLRAHLAARLGASRLLRVVVSGPGAGENPEDSRLTAASARAFLRAMLMLRFDRGLGGTKNDRTRDGFRNEDAVHARACSLVVRAAAEGLRDWRALTAPASPAAAGEDILAATGTPNARLRSRRLRGASRPADAFAFAERRARRRSRAGGRGGRRDTQAGMGGGVVPRERRRPRVGRVPGPRIFRSSARGGERTSPRDGSRLEGVRGCS